ncbi:MAG: amidohydrolase, partial [Flavobacteriaceae bacterium]|nr:amidohydrolase [Flavobacteriaceae bacterium]
QTATINPSIYFNLQDSLGRIKNNYVADLIILAKNPLEDIRNTKSILAVIKDGNYLDRNYLDSIVR